MGRAGLGLGHHKRRRWTVLVLVSPSLDVKATLEPRHRRTRGRHTFVLLVEVGHRRDVEEEERFDSLELLAGSLLGVGGPPAVGDTTWDWCNSLWRKVELIEAQHDIKGVLERTRNVDALQRRGTRKRARESKQLDGWHLTSII